MNGSKTGINTRCMKKRKYNIVRGDLLKVVQELGVSHSLVKQISNGTYQHVDSGLYSKVHKALNEISEKRDLIEKIKATL